MWQNCQMTEMHLTFFFFKPTNQVRTLKSKLASVKQAPKLVNIFRPRMSWSIPQF